MFRELHRYPIASCLSMALLLLMPNSQARVSTLDVNVSQIDAEFIGYACQLGFQLSEIRIEFTNSNDGLPCEVNLITNGGEPQFLLQAKRHLNACAIKAENMSLRLIDRGWSCQSAAL